MNKIENIIFDFGGVLYNIDLDRSMTAFQDLGFNLQESNDVIFPIFLDLEIGKINTATFIKRLQIESGKKLSEKDILHAFNLILIGIDPKKVADLRKIKEKYQLFLLSNTNVIHYNIFTKEIKLNKSTNDFYELFNKEYYSYKLKMRKPDLSIFKYVLNDSNLDPIGTLFVDDSYENITAAASLGIQTFWIENDNSWDILLSFLNVKP